MPLMVWELNSRAIWRRSLRRQATGQTGKSKWARPLLRGPLHYMWLRGTAHSYTERTFQACFERPLRCAKRRQRSPTARSLRLPNTLRHESGVVGSNPIGCATRQKNRLWLYRTFSEFFPTCGARLGHFRVFWFSKIAAAAISSRGRQTAGPQFTVAAAASDGENGANGSTKLQQPGNRQFGCGQACRYFAAVA